MNTTVIITDNTEYTPYTQNLSVDEALKTIDFINSLIEERHQEQIEEFEKDLCRLIEQHASNLSKDDMASYLRYGTLNLYYPY